MDGNELGKRIKDRRVQLDISAQEMANMLNLSKATIHRYESGEIKRIKLPVVESMGKILRVNPLWLIGKSSEMTDRTKLDVSVYKDVRRLVVDVITYINETDVHYSGHKVDDSDKNLLSSLLETAKDSLDSKYKNKGR